MTSLLHHAFLDDAILGFLDSFNIASFVLALERHATIHGIVVVLRRRVNMCNNFRNPIETVCVVVFELVVHPFRAIHIPIRRYIILSKSRLS